MKKGKNKKSGPCWEGYEMVGMKMKGKRKVPNCVPVKKSKGGGADMSEAEVEKKPGKVFADPNKRRKQIRNKQNPNSEYGPKGKLKYTFASTGKMMRARGSGCAIKGTNFKGVF